ncbi:MAG: glutamate--tRNA ligase [Patescibacteria group bacterium]|nr:glutamate--tRNA ligase [Patescibacteria group bacterium]
MAKIITRFPPSPTGNFHIGSARTALFNYLFANHNGGEMLFRFEDTDRERSKPEFEKDIIEGLAWLGLHTAPSAFRQSERTEIYKKHLLKLIENGAAFEAEDSTTTLGMKVVRFKNPNKTVTFHDAVRGDITFDTTELGDFIIARTHDLPLYHLAVVIDDAEMGVTHIIRGEDHISNTQRQLLLIEALGFVRPEYAHIPLILAPDKSKLSKRHGAVSLSEYRAQGFVPEALVNYLALLGWNPGGERELYTLGELEKEFTLDRVHKSGAIFNIEKLTWFNFEHLKQLSNEEYTMRLKEFTGRDVDARIVPLIKERAQTLAEAARLLGEYDFLGAISYAPELLLQGGKIATEVASNHLRALAVLLEPVPDEGFSAAQLKSIIMPYADSQGRGVVLWPLRVALSGREKSPDPFTLAALMGKKETLARIARAVESL